MVVWQMWGNNHLLKRVNNLKKNIPKPEDEVDYLIEVGTEKNGGSRTYKIINGIKHEISGLDIDPKKFKDIDIKVTIPEDLEC
jgi:hypothetical protein